MPRSLAAARTRTHWRAPASSVGEPRAAAEEFTTAVADSASLTGRLKLLQEELAALVTAHSDRNPVILTLVTVTAPPINLLAGLPGMNVGGIPPAQHPAGFFVVVGILSPVTSVLAYFLLIRKRERPGRGLRALSAR